jgi:hypothetical protein
VIRYGDDRSSQPPPGIRDIGQGPGAPRTIYQRYSTQERHQEHRICRQRSLERRYRHHHCLARLEDPQTPTLPLVTTDDDSAAQRTANLVENTSTPSQKKSDAITSERPFRLLVLSLCGMLETEARDAPETRDALNLWKSIMTGGGYSLLNRLSFGLLRARALCFKP